MNTPAVAASPAGVNPKQAPTAIASLDGIRALAVMLVFFAHGGLEQIVPGGLGVTIFFVLSGYLITTLMRREYTATGSVALGAFYLRRALRLIPPLLIVVATAALLSAMSLIDGGFTLRGLLSVLFYFGNYHVIASDFHGIPAGLGVVWSLAVEEHYYLLYPPLAIALLRSASRRIAATVLGALCVAMLLWRFWLYQHGADHAYITMATDTRADAILIGSLMALLYNPAIDAVAKARPFRDGAVLILCLVVLLATLVYRNELFRLTARYTLQSLAIAPLIYLAITRAGSLPFRWLSSRPMVYLGTVSYMIYLSHQLILFGLMRHWPQWGEGTTMLVTAILTLGVAEPVRRWIEQPCARLRQRLHPGTSRASSAAPPMPLAVPLK